MTGVKGGFVSNIKVCVQSIYIVIIPHCNMHMQGRHAPPRRCKQIMHPVTHAQTLCAHAHTVDSTTAARMVCCPVHR